MIDPNELQAYNIFFFNHQVYNMLNILSSLQIRKVSIVFFQDALRLKCLTQSRCMHH